VILELERSMVETKQAGKGVLRLVRGDVTLLDVDAFVFYANHDLKLGSGFGGAIAVRGGPTIQKELDELGTRETCEAVVTEAGELKARFIIHAVGPRFQEPELEEKLRRTMRSTFELANEKELETLAFPPMGAGFYGIPLDQCARVMVEEIERHLEGETSLEEVIICVQDTRERIPFEARLAAD
jgi:O-acetyl-ADP-ribose deacetylase (regulator of RNase III)